MLSTDEYREMVRSQQKEEIDDLVESLSTAENRSKGLVKFVQTTKDLARLPEPTISEIHVADLFNRLRGFFKNDIKKHKIDFKLILCQPDIIIKADLEMIEQVLINLIENSMKFGKTAAKREINISARIHDDENRVKIRVSDSGPGIPRHALKKVFNDFYRVDNSLTRTTRGTGIGLALVKKFVILMGGTVAAENNEGQGCTITISLPI